MKIALGSTKKIEQNGITVNVNKTTVTISNGASKYIIKTKPSISYHSDIADALDFSKYSKENTIEIDIEIIKKCFEDQMNKKRKLENDKNAIKTKKLLFSAYVIGKLVEVGFDVDDLPRTILSGHNILILETDSWSFYIVFDYSDKNMLNLDFDDLKINSTIGFMKFSDFLKHDFIKDALLYIKSRRTLDKLEEKLEKYAD